MDNSGVSQTSLELLLELDGNLNDTSVNARHQSSAVGAVTYDSDGAVSQCAKFSYALRNHIDTGTTALGSADLFCTGGQSFTFATFLRFAGASRFGTGTLIARQEGTGAEGISTSNFFVHVTEDKRLLVRLRGQDNYYSVSMHDAAHHHIAVVWNGTTATVYFDGLSIGTATVGGVAENTHNIFIGGSSLPDIPGLPTSNLVGQLDDLRVYSRALSAAEILQLYNYGLGDIPAESENLELYLKFEGNLLDSSVNERHQTDNLETSGSASLTYSSNRKVDEQSSVWADGATDGDIFIDTGVTDLGAASLFAALGEAWSVAFWTRDTGLDGGVPISKGDVFSSQHGLAIWNNFDAIGSAETQVFIRGATEGVGRTTYVQGTLNDGDWHHHAVTWNGTAAKYYYDGVAQVDPTVGANVEQGNIIIGAVVDTNGANPPTTVNYGGGLDDLRVYSRALSADDVTTLFGLTPAPMTATLSLISIAGAVATLRVVFSRSATGFAADDVTATNGTVSDVAGSGTTYTFNVTASADGQVTAFVEAGAVLDSSSVTNLVSNTVSWGVGSVASSSGTGLLRFDRTVAPTHTARALIGPIKISENTFLRSIIQRLRVVLGSGTTATGTVKIAVGVDGEDAITRALDGGHQYSVTIASLLANAGICLPRVAGHAAVIDISVTTGHLTLEGIDAMLQEQGRSKAARYVA